MKKISEVEEKPFTSSSNVSPDASVERGIGGQSNASHPPPYLLADPRIFTYI
jgi:hypothetical protein